MAANNPAAAAPWQVSAGVPLTTGEIAQTILRASDRPQGKVKNAACPANASILLLDDALTLNHAHVNAMKWYRRAMRKQGRIDRMMCKGARALFLFLISLPNAQGKSVLNDAQAELDAVERLMRGETGPSLLRRLRRPQSEINERLSRAVVILAHWATAPERGFVPAGAGGRELVESILWHANEAEYLSLRRKRRKAIVRRYKCDQYQLNRCAIIAMRKTAELFMTATKPYNTIS